MGGIMSSTIDTIITSYAVRRYPRVPDARRMITAKDIYEVPRMVAQGFLAWTLPEAAWWPLSRLFAQLDVAMNPARTRQEVAQIRVAYAGTPIASEARSVAVESWANRYEDRFHYLRAWRPGGWEPDIAITGTAHVSEALERGRGIISWAGVSASIISSPRWPITASGFMSVTSAALLTASRRPGSVSVI